MICSDTGGLARWPIAQEGVVRCQSEEGEEKLDLETKKTQTLLIIQLHGLLSVQDKPRDDWLHSCTAGVVFQTSHAKTKIRKTKTYGAIRVPTRSNHKHQKRILFMRLIKLFKILNTEKIWLKKFLQSRKYLKTKIQW